MGDKLSAVGDISSANKRARQPSLVDMLEGIRVRADAGEIVGAVVIYIDSDGVWNHKRDLFGIDTPTMLGFMQLVELKIGQHYLDGCGDDTDNEQDAS